MKKRPILLKSICGLGEQKSKKIIGLVGTHRGVGVTHTGLLISEFLGNTLGRKTAFLERNMHGDFMLIEQAYYGEGGCEELFKIKKVTYYKQVTDRKTAELLNENFEYYILDLGIDLGKNRDEFLRCDMKIVIGSLTDWKRKNLQEFIECNQNLIGHEQWVYLMVFGQQKDLQQWNREMRLRAKSLGYEPVPDMLSKETMGLFRSVF